MEEADSLLPISRNLFVVWLLIYSSLAMGAQESSDMHPYLTDTFFLDVGAFFPDRKLSLSVNGSIGGDNPIIDFGEEFRLKESDETFAIDFGWRLKEKWRLVGQYFESSGGSTWILDEDIEWGDVVFLEGTNASVGNDFKLFRAFVGRDFSKSERHEFGVGAGIHLLEFGAFIEGTILVEGGGMATGFESVTTQGPVPNIGGWYKYSISENWALRGRLDWLSANIGKYDGQLTNVSFGVNYQVARYFGIGLNYHDFELDVTVDESDWRGRVITSYEGLYLYLSFFW